MIKNPTVERIQSFACAQRLYRLGVIVHVVVDVLVIGAALSRPGQRRVRRAETALGTRRATAWRIERKMESISKDHAGGGEHKRKKNMKENENQSRVRLCMMEARWRTEAGVCVCSQDSTVFTDLHQFFSDLFCFQVNDKCRPSRSQQLSPVKPSTAPPNHASLVKWRKYRSNEENIAQTG